MKNNGETQHLHSFAAIKSQAASAAKVWKTNRKFQLNDVNLEDYEKIRAEFDQLMKIVAERERELDELTVARQRMGMKLKKLNVRVRTGMRGYFGRQSSQYEQVMGNCRKKAVRKAGKPAATEETPITAPVPIES
jgi:hypothetical protein